MKDERYKKQSNENGWIYPDSEASMSSFGARLQFVFDYQGYQAREWFTKQQLELKKFAEIISNKVQDSTEEYLLVEIGTGRMKHQQLIANKTNEGYIQIILETDQINTSTTGGFSNGTQWSGYRPKSFSSSSNRKTTLIQINKDGGVRVGKAYEFNYGWDNFDSLSHKRVVEEFEVIEDDLNLTIGYISEILGILNDWEK